MTPDSLTPDDQKDSMALVIAILEHDSDAARALLAGNPRNGDMLLGAARFIGARLDPGIREEMLTEARAALRRLAGEAADG
jgi:hypothetical protein